jgi:RNA polymerase sigma factor (sigma-70 family)
MATIKDRVLIDPTQEADSVARAQAGDIAARDYLLEKYFSFAVAQCRYHGTRKNLDRDDAESEASLAILDAIARFDPSRGSNFRTYLAHRCRGAVTSAAREEAKSKTIDVTKRPAFKKPRPFNQWEWKVAKLGRQVADYWPQEAVRWIRKLPRHNDRIIARNIWLRYPPMRPASVARRLKVSRSAVTQRIRWLKLNLQEKFKITFFGEYVMRNPLNEIWDFAIYDEYDDNG